MRTAQCAMLRWGSSPLMNALAEATIDFIIRDPANADKHGMAGFEALWRIVA